MGSDRATLSVVIPVYNEAVAITEVLRRVCAAPLPAWCKSEVVVVDDGSTDKTLDSIREFSKAYPGHADKVRLYQSLINHGKGAALRAGFKIAEGDIVLVQDGDLEYFPDDTASSSSRSTTRRRTSSTVPASPTAGRRA